MNTNSPQVPPPSPEPRKHSRLGIGSFISAVVALLSICPFILLQMGVQPPIQLSDIIVVTLMGLGGLAALIGTGLGIAAMIQDGTSKTFGILGFVFNVLILGLFLLGFCAFDIYILLFILWVSGGNP